MTICCKEIGCVFLKLLLTGAFAYTDAQLQAIEALGYTPVFVQEERCALDVDCKSFDAAVCNSLFLYNDIALFENLKFVQLTSAGLDRVPLDYMHDHGILLRNARGVYSVPMAEWVVLKLLEIYKASARFYANQQARLWQKERGLLELCGKTVCIVGYGSVGQAVAVRLKAFGCRVLAVDQKLSVADESIDGLYSVEQLDAALAQSDAVVLTLPLTKETYHLFDAKRFSVMRAGSVFINVARGGLVDEQALISALQSGVLKGAALDVFENEPLFADSPLWKLDNVLLSPHNSFVSEQTQGRLFELIYTNLRAFARGEL